MVCSMGHKPLNKLKSIRSWNVPHKDILMESKHPQMLSFLKSVIRRTPVRKPVTVHTRNVSAGETEESPRLAGQAVQLSQ